MRFRTEIEIIPTNSPLCLQDNVLSLGSCFSQAVGNRLIQGGINTSVTPMGILFNPRSIAGVINRALDRRPFTEADLYCDDSGIWHALDFESRRQNRDAEVLLGELNQDFLSFSDCLVNASCWLITFGTAWCFRHLPTDKIVGNCHKLPDVQFEREQCSVAEIIEIWNPILEAAPRVIFTVSPVRHLNDGLHGNTVSKSRLHLAVEQLCAKHPNVEYFPAFEALNDDLRDYRFYADDMKHPSQVAEEYIFELFCRCYFDAKTRQVLEENRRKSRLLGHRPIINPMP